MTLQTNVSATLLVAEVFGPTLQGEGPSAGRTALFVRLSRCNLSCPRCDTPYTWNWEKFDIHESTMRMTDDDVLTFVDRHPAVELVVITGGEPLLQQHKLVGLTRELAARGRRVEIESNGTVAPLPELVACVGQFNVSPKLAAFAAAEDELRRVVPAALTALAESGKSIFKFVASDIGDLDEIAVLVDRYALRPVWVMPEGVTAEGTLSKMRLLADHVINRGWNMTSRLHVLLWGDERGR
ncbi:7-carboxy-7-deazaguanine synthase QueE [Catellatospora citrea]|uniref:7-carboxy-7-deazaguanine synthase QueE n=1 Tax=Catellatospora citrea TaxID=53366 RepID=UPI0033C62B05